jgi:hypothetical protein
VLTLIRFALLFGVALASSTGCSGVNAGNIQPGEAWSQAAEMRSMPAVPHSVPAVARDGALYYLYADGPLHRVRLDGPPWREKPGYGSPNGFGLAVDSHRRVYEAFSDPSGSGSGVAVLNPKLSVERTISFGTERYAIGIAVDGHDQTYVVCESVRNLLEFSIEIFAADASGPATPLRTIRGAKAGLTLPTALAVDASGNLYVTISSLPSDPRAAVGNGGLVDRILVFGPTANGNVAPLRAIAGTSTGLTDPLNLALGADGNLYVANQTMSGYDVLVFPASGSGNIAPLWTLQSTPYGASLALGAGGELYLGPGNARNHGFAIYAPGASGNAAPIGFAGNPLREGYPSRIALEHPWTGP